MSVLTGYLETAEERLERAGSRLRAARDALRRIRREIATHGRPRSERR